MLSTNCYRGLKFRTGKGPIPSAAVLDGCRQTTATGPTTNTRYDDPPRQRSDCTTSVREIQAGEDRPSLLAESIVDSTDDVGSNDPSESDTGRHAVVFEADSFETVEHLPGIEKRRNLEIGRDAGDFCPGQVYALFDARGDQVLVDEPIDPVTPKIVLPPQRTLFKKGHLPSKRRLQISSYDLDSLGKSFFISNS